MVRYLWTPLPTEAIFSARLSWIRTAFIKVDEQAWEELEKGSSLSVLEVRVAVREAVKRKKK
jgi:hypothetical protein